MDQGHVIADSLGGVPNTYNITPQDSVLNRHGDHAYLEETIRRAGGATNFEAIITYPNTTTQVPSHCKYTYTINGYQIVAEFENINPDEYNEARGIKGEGETSLSANEPEAATPSSSPEGDVSTVDANGNGIVPIHEAKDVVILHADYFKALVIPIHERWGWRWTSTGVNSSKYLVSDIRHRKLPAVT